MEVWEEPCYGKDRVWEREKGVGWAQSSSTDVVRILGGGLGCKKGFAADPPGEKSGGAGTRPGVRKRGRGQSTVFVFRVSLGG